MKQNKLVHFENTASVHAYNAWSREREREREVVKIVRDLISFGSRPVLALAQKIVLCNLTHNFPWPPYFQLTASASDFHLFLITI